MFLTRAGNFTIDGNRQLVTAQGFFVLDEGGGIIQLADNVESFSIAADGTIIQVLDDGEIDDTIVIGLARVSNPSGLQKVGNNLYALTPNADEADDAERFNWTSCEEGQV